MRGQYEVTAENAGFKKLVRRDIILPVSSGLTERWNLQLRLDAPNLTNRSQMNAPSADPYSSNFGKITSQTAATNGWIQVQARLTF